MHDRENTMKKSQKIFKVLGFVFLALTVFWQCKKSDFPDRDIEKKALAISKKLDGGSICTFNEWGFSKRNNIEIWAKNAGDSISYGFLYFKQDTVKFTLFGIDALRKDYPFNAKVNTGDYYTVDFSQTKDLKITIAGTNKDGVRDTIISNIPSGELFTASNPFEKLKSLSDFANDLGILNTFHKADLGNFIEFYLSPEYVLTYLPDDLYINPNHKNKIEKDFASGKMIRKNWNLRKLAKPVDIG